MSGKVQSAVPLLVPYPIEERVKLVAALAVRELGLVEKLKGVMVTEEDGKAKEEVGHQVSGKEVDHQDDQAHSNTLTQLAASPEVAVDEVAVLEEIFNTPDVDASGSKEGVSFLEFQRSALLLVGLGGMVERANSDQNKLKLLEAGRLEPQPMFLILSFFHQCLSAGGLEEILEPWLGEVVAAVTQLLNLQLQHPFLEDCGNLCTEFLEDSLPSLLVLEEEHLQSALTSFLALLCKSRAVGKHAISCIIARFSHLAEDLREAEQFCCSPSDFLREFDLLVRLLFELWPWFLTSVLPSRSQSLRKESGSSLVDMGDLVPKKASKKRSSGGGGFQPLLGLRETTDLQAQVARWQIELEGCTAQLSILHPEFCETIWSVVTLCKGLLDNLVC